MKNAFDIPITHFQVSRRELLVAGCATSALAAIGLAFPDIAFADKLDDQIAAKQSEVERLAGEIADLQAEIEDILDKMHSAEEERDTAQAEKEDAEKAIELAQTMIEENNQRIAELQESMAEQMRLRYKSDDMGLYDVVMESTTFDQFVNRWNMLQRFNESSAAAVGQVKHLRGENQKKLKDLEELKRTAEDKASEAEKKAAEQHQLELEAKTKVSQLEGLQNSATLEVQQLVEKKREIELEIQRAQAAAGGKVRIIGNPHDIEPSPEVVPYAQSKIGAKYVYGAKGPTVFDCSGLTQWVYKQIGVKIPSAPSTNYDRAIAVGAVLPISLSEPGDVLMRPGHVALVTKAAGAEFIHAPGVGKYVEYGTDTHKRGFLCALRFPRP